MVGVGKEKQSWKVERLQKKGRRVHGNMDVCKGGSMLRNRLSRVLFGKGIVIRKADGTRLSRPRHSVGRPRDIPRMTHRGIVPVKRVMYVINASCNADYCRSTEVVRRGAYLSTVARGGFDNRI